MPENESVSVTEVRRWAKTAGYDVPARGALKSEIYDAYNARDRSADNDPTESADTLEDTGSEPSTSDDAPAGHSDAAGIEDEVTATVSTDEPVSEPVNESVDERPADEEDSKTDDAYNDAWRYATGFEHDWTGSRQLRNRVSVQTLDNGFIHAQRATGTDEVQARLAERGFLRGTAHGLADEDTVQAYARFQDSIGLPGTGIPERTSLEALGFDVLE